MYLIVCFLASSFQITLRNPSSAEWESRGCMQNVISYAKHVNYFIECLKKIYAQALVEISTFIGQIFDLHWSKFLPFLTNIFYHHWSKFLPLLVEIFIFLGQNCTMAMGIFRPILWLKFWPTYWLVEISTGKILTNDLVDVGRSMVKKWVEILTNNGRKMASDVVVYERVHC